MKVYVVIDTDPDSSIQDAVWGIYRTREAAQELINIQLADIQYYLRIIEEDLI